MGKENERPFRKGESREKPIGGNVADVPFSKILHCLMTKGGFESQNTFAKALGKNSNAGVGRWIRGKRAPLPEEFGKILVMLKPNDEELEMLVDAYGELLRKKAEGRTERPVLQTKAADNPFGQWVEKICRDKNISVSKFMVILGYSKNTRIMRKPGKLTLDSISERAPEALDLTQEQRVSLVEAVHLEIQRGKEQKRKFREYVAGREIWRMQREAGDISYNNAQVANKLGVSRERIKQLKIQFDVTSKLLKQEDIEMFRKHLDKTREQREKYQETRRENRKKKSENP